MGSLPHRHHFHSPIVLLLTLFVLVLGLPAAAAPAGDIVVTKSPSLGSVSEPGGTVTFSVVVGNLTPVDMEVLSLGDDVFGDLLDAGNGRLPGGGCRRPGSCGHGERPGGG